MEECLDLLKLSKETRKEFNESASAVVRDSRCGDSSLFCCPHLCGKGIKSGKSGKVEQTDRIVHGDDATLGKRVARGIPLHCSKPTPTSARPATSSSYLPPVPPSSWLHLKRCNEMSSLLP